MRGTHQGRQSARTALTGRTHDCKRHLHHAQHDLLHGGGHPHMKRQAVPHPRAGFAGELDRYRHPEVEDSRRRFLFIAYAPSSTRLPNCL